MWRYIVEVNSGISGGTVGYVTSNEIAESQNALCTDNMYLARGFDSVQEAEEYVEGNKISYSSVKKVWING